MTDQNGNPLNLYGYTGSATLKKWYTSQNSVPFGVSINATAGTLTLSLSPNTTIGMNPGRYVYDVNIFDSSNNSSRIVEGIAEITPAVGLGANSVNQTWYQGGYSDG